MKQKWIDAFMDTARRFSMLSPATRLKVGCVIVEGGNRIISIGYNGTPPGWDNSCEDEFGNTKPEVIHAEENAIAKLAGSNSSACGTVLFVTHSPCMHCARLIANAGIVQVYYDILYRDAAGLDHLDKRGVQAIKV